jgi:uncharacterized protein YjbI with pentapeptide repeats
MLICFLNFMSNIYIIRYKMEDTVVKIATDLQNQKNETLEIHAAIKLAKENAAATTIGTAYKFKMRTDANYKSLGDYICTDLGRSLEYRTKLPVHINKLYLYYCKLGSKSFGYKLNKKVASYAVKQISNSVFVNTSFASTDFTGIKFKSCKFISGIGKYLTGYSKGMNVRKRNLTSRHPKADKTDAIMNFEKSILANCLIEESRFYGVHFIDIKYGSVINDNTNLENDKFKRSIEATRFYRCVFNSTIHDRGLQKDEVILSTIRTGQKTDDKYLMTFKEARTIDDWTNKRKKNLFDIVRVEKKVSPFLVYEESKFNNATFGNNTRHINTLYLNCEFNTSFKKYALASKISFDNIEFRNCQFNDSYFENCVFNHCNFNMCKFSNVLFLNCNLAGRACVMHKCVFTGGGGFSQCHFSQSGNLLNKLQFDNECDLTGVIFQFNIMRGYAFNEDAITMPDTSHAKPMLKMNNCKFYRNILFGTSFDYCDLEGSSFAGPEEINWFGHVLLSVNKSYMLSVYNRLRAVSSNAKMIDIDKTELTAKDVSEIIKNNTLLESVLNTKTGLASIKHSSAALTHILEESDYIRSGFPGGSDEFIKTYDISPWDYINSAGDNILYFVPATSFEGANIKTCNFQSMQGFEGFDFTRLAKYKLPPNNQPNINLNAVNFTDVNLTNANFEGANLIGTIFQVAVVNSANFKNTIINEHTDFENTMGIATILNGDHINFGALQNNANETHSRANLIINNRNKYKDYYSIYKNEDKIDFFYYNEMHNRYHAKLMKFMKENYHDNDINPEDYIIYHEKFAYNFGVDYNNIHDIWFELTISELHRDRNEEQTRTKPLPIDNLFVLNYSVDEILSGSVAPHCNQALIDFITMGITKRLHWNKTQLAKLKAELDIIIDQSFMKIATSYKPPLNDAPIDAKENWCWLDLIVESLLFLFSCPAVYINSFFEFYFNEVFNAHGVGSRSCTLGMVERLVTIHSQTVETFIMTMDVKPTRNNVKAISEYNEIDTTIIDPQITVEFITNFNKPQLVDNKHIMLLLRDEFKKLSSERVTAITKFENAEARWHAAELYTPEKYAAEKDVENADKEMDILQEKIYTLREEMKGAVNESKLSTNMDKYKLNKFLNLLKPNSTLPENAEDDMGINLDFDIKAEWRDEFMVPAKVKVDNGEIETLDELAKYYLIWMTNKILISNNITDELIETIKKRGGNQTKLLVTKLKELDTFLKTNEIPQFKEAVIMMTSAKVTKEELVEYFEGGSKSFFGGIRHRSAPTDTRKKNIKTTRSKLSNKTMSIRISTAQIDKIDTSIVKAFVKLPKDKISTAFNKAFVQTPAYIPRNMTIEYPAYRKILKKRVLKIKGISKILATNKDVVNNYIEKLKKSKQDKDITMNLSNASGGSRKKFTKKQNRSSIKWRCRTSHTSLKKATLKRRKKYSSKRK